MRCRALFPFLTIMLALGGCAADVQPKEGIEDYVPLDGKADGFRSPTEHGQLRYDSPSRSELTDDAKFHAWEFALGGSAEVSLEILSRTPNLDTVMYLYRRDPGEARWGRYIARNDDNGSSLLSAINKDLGAGEYRIIVKGYKEHHRGPFAVETTCAGAGCEAPAPTDPIDVPGETSFTTGCVDRLRTSMKAEVTSTDGFSIHPETSEGFDREVLISTAHYADVSDWDEYVNDDERDEFTFDVDVVKTEAGSVVTMADGGDESTTEYAFDTDGNLLAYYVHNQSPWTGFFCGDSSEEEVEMPNEDCVSAWISNGPRRGQLNEGTETFDPGAPNDEIDERMAQAVVQYQTDVLDGDDSVVISIEFSDWESAEDGLGGEYLLSAENHEMVSYTVVDSYYGDPWVVFVSSENSDEGMQMTCTH